MRTVILALLVLLAFNCGEGLRCNHCSSSSLDGCHDTVVTCENPGDICGRVIQYHPPPLPLLYFKQCMTEIQCRRYGAITGVSAHCCSTDLCN